MNKLNGYVVFWLEYQPSQERWGPRCAFYNSDQMSFALKEMDQLRKDENIEFVTMASQSDFSVGKPGVTSVTNGLLPSGEKYDWVKRRPPVSVNLTDEKIVEIE